MWWFAHFLWLVGSLPWLLFLWSAKPTRGENMMGIHLILGPAAMPPTIAMAMHLVTGPFGHFGWAMALLLPGAWVGLLALPAMAMDRRHGVRCKVGGTIVLLAIGAAGSRIDGAPWLPWLGFALVAALGVTSYGVIGFAWLRPRFRRFGRRSTEPSSWELQQAELQRQGWQKTAPTTVEALLPFSRSFAPDVRASCLQQLAAHPDLDAVLAARLETKDDFDTLQYFVHHYPRPRRTMAAAVSKRLTEEHARWAELLAKSDDATRWLGNIVPLLDAGVAVLKDGGDVRTALTRWRDTLVANPRYKPLGRQIAKYLK